MPRHKSVTVDWPEDLELLTYYYKKHKQLIYTNFNLKLDLESCKQITDADVLKLGNIHTLYLFGC